MRIITQGRTIEDFRTIPNLVGDSTIMSTSDKPDLQYWKLEFSGDERKTWNSIFTMTQRSSTPIGQVWKTSTVPDGDYWLRSVMVNKSGNFSDPCEIKVTIKNTTSTSVSNAPSCKDARASITEPKVDGIVAQHVSVYGSAQVDNFSYYQMQYSTDRNTWANIGARAPSALPSGLLGVWDASGLPDGDYWLRVLVIDKTSNYQSDPCQVHVVLKNAGTRSPALCGTSPTAYIAWLQIVRTSGPITVIKSLQPPIVASDMLGFIGSVNTPDLARYIIQYSADDKKTWVDAASFSSPQVAETGFGGFQTRTVPNGDYWLHIRIVNKTGNYQDICEFPVTVKN